jgi:uncharacterized protein
VPNKELTKEISMNTKIMILAAVATGLTGIARAVDSQSFNRAPLKEKPYAELALGAVKPAGWLETQLQIMAEGMTGHLDELYSEVCGPNNAWLGGEGDAWERGPYWIDGLYPLAVMLDDSALKQKVKPWIEWALNSQQPSGQFGPVPVENRTRAPLGGVQVQQPLDWWPRMVVLKILQQHYNATEDERVVDFMTRYFRFQLEDLPKHPLHAPDVEGSGSWWARQRGGDNLMVVYWLYNITGDKFLLEVGDLVYKQTFPFTETFLADGDKAGIKKDQLYNAPHIPVPKQNDDGLEIANHKGFHCVNLGQGMKTPLIRFQADGDSVHLRATEKAFDDIRAYHGQPHSLFGGDEAMHGTDLTRGSELCTAAEMLFSLEKMLEISGDMDFANRMEEIAYNVLPTQVSDDYMTRQYYQQANQIEVSLGDRNFHNDNGDRIVFGLLSGYPCCTCNMHQTWPKFIQHLWMGSKDGGLAALVYGPSVVTTEIGGTKVTIEESTNYPMEDRITMTLRPDKPVEFPLHLRIPEWTSKPTLKINGEPVELNTVKQVAVIRRTWKSGDRVELDLPADFRVERWHEQSASVHRGPLLFTLHINKK